MFWIILICTFQIPTVTECFDNTENDFNESLLRLQLHFLKERTEGKNETWEDVYQMAKEMSYAQREIILWSNQADKTDLPLHSSYKCPSERAASAVHRMKTIWRATWVNKGRITAWFCIFIKKLLILCYCLNVPMTSFPTNTEENWEIYCERLVSV